jgi:hypothetical protein
MAQDVEKSHPEAVGEVGGFKTVDYDAATSDAAGKRHFADGGPVGFFDIPTYIPKFGGAQSASPYGSAPTLQMSAPKQQDPMGGVTPQAMMGASKGLKSLFGGDTTPTGFTGNTDVAFPGIDGATTSYMGGVSYPMFGAKRGAGSTVTPASMTR